MSGSQARLLEKDKSARRNLDKYGACLRPDSNRSLGGSRVASALRFGFKTPNDTRSASLFSIEKAVTSDLATAGINCAINLGLIA